jgi:hypothetical protein
LGRKRSQGNDPLRAWRCASTISGRALHAQDRAGSGRLPERTHRAGLGATLVRGPRMSGRGIGNVSSADFDTPAPAGAGTSASGSRTARRNFRVETLISIRSIAYFSASPLRPHDPSSAAQGPGPRIAHPRPLNRYLEADLALGPPQRCPRRPSLRTWRAPQASLASLSIIAPSGSTPAARQNRSKLTGTWSYALPTARVSAGAKTIDVVLTLFVALFSFRGIGTPSLPAQSVAQNFPASPAS